MQYSLNKSSLGGIVNVFKYLLIFSFIIELAGAIALFIYWYPSMGAGKALWYGVFHSISAFNNAGFDLFGNFASLTGFTGDAMLAITISALLLSGGLGFIVIYELINYPRVRSLSLHSRVVLITTAIMVGDGNLLF